MSKHKNKTKKHKKVVHTKTVHKKTKLRTKTKPKTQTTKRQSDVLVLPNRTPKNINELSKEISNDIDTSNDKIDNNGSYSPSINKELVLLESVKRKDVHNCNNSKAFLLE
jgi:hypothetical protein